MRKLAMFLVGAIVVSMSWRWLKPYLGWLGWSPGDLKYAWQMEGLLRELRSHGHGNYVRQDCPRCTKPRAGPRRPGRREP